MSPSDLNLTMKGQCWCLTVFLVFIETHSKVSVEFADVSESTSAFYCLYQKSAIRWRLGTLPQRGWFSHDKKHCHSLDTCFKIIQVANMQNCNTRKFHSFELFLIIWSAVLVCFETRSHFVAHTGLGSQDILKTLSFSNAENQCVHCRLVLVGYKLVSFGNPLCL